VYWVQDNSNGSILLLLLNIFFLSALYLLFYIYNTWVTFYTFSSATVDTAQLFLKHTSASKQGMLLQSFRIQAMSVYSDVCKNKWNCFGFLGQARVNTNCPVTQDRLARSCRTMMCFASSKGGGGGRGPQSILWTLFHWFSHSHTLGSCSLSNWHETIFNMYSMEKYLITPVLVIK
jgi:hypothetical protein